MKITNVFNKIKCDIVLCNEESNSHSDSSDIPFIERSSSKSVRIIGLGFLMYLTVFKTVKDYAATARTERIQLVLTEDTLEITTDFSKEIIPYNEIDFCYEKNFLLTLITDKNSFPVSVSKVHVEKGDYDTFVSLLKSRITGRYEKKGENW